MKPPSPGPHNWIRNNILGLVAIFIALNGSAIATTIAVKSGSKDSANAKASKKAKAGRRGPAGATGAQGAAGAQGLQGIQGVSGVGGAPGGAAGGELSGTYPNPEIGTVAALDLVESDARAGGINFGDDTNLFRLGPNALQTDDSFTVNGDLSVSGSDAVLPPNSVGGPEIDESSLGAVPSAASAANADALDTLDSLAFQRQRVRNLNGTGPTVDVAGTSLVTFGALPGPIALTDLTGGVAGQVVTLMIFSGTRPNVDDGGNFSLASNWSGDSDDTLTLIKISNGQWVEVSRSVN